MPVLKKIKFSFTSLGIILSILVSSCASTDNIGPYKQDWTLDLAVYLDTQYDLQSYQLSDYSLTLLDDKTILVGEMSKKGRHLVEVDVTNGKFLNQLVVDFGEGDPRKRKDGSVLVSGYNGYDFLLENYDKGAHTLNLLSAIDPVTISDPSSSRAIYPGDDILYTHNSNIAPNSDNVYIAKWNFDGTSIWKKNIDPSNKKKVAFLPIIQADYLFYVNVEDYGLTGENWKIGKLSADGNVLWNKTMNNYGWIFEAYENGAGDLFVLNWQGVSKHDSEGNILWSKDLSSYTGAQGIWGNGVVSSDGGILFQLHTQKNGERIMKINSAGQMVWDQKYWEDDPGNTITLKLIELPSRNLVVLSSKGHLTLFKRS